MFGEFWVNLPVRNVLKTDEFYKSLGFRSDFEHGGKDIGVKIFAGSQGTIAWFYAEKVFENFAHTLIAAKQLTIWQAEFSTQAAPFLLNLLGRLIGFTVAASPI